MTTQQSSLGKAIFVCVSRRCPNGNVTAPDACGFWVFKSAELAKANQCEVLVAIVRSVVCGVWKIKKNNGQTWRKGSQGMLVGRKQDSGDADRYFCEVEGPVHEELIGRRIDQPNEIGRFHGEAFRFNF